MKTRAVVCLISFMVTLLSYSLLQTLKEKQIFLGFTVASNPISYYNIEAITQQTGILPGFINFFQAWPQKGAVASFPITTLQVIDDVGAIACVSWEPQCAIGQQKKGVLLNDIQQGHYDAYIRTFAKSAKEWGKPFMIRLAHEMNLRTYHWAVSQDAYNEQSPECYKAMFRYIVNIFKEENADNVFFVFCPNVVSVPDTQWNMAKNYYPGDDCIDIFGMDGYNWENNPDTQKQSFKELFKPLYAELKNLNPTLPIFVFETAAVVNKEKWLQECFTTAEEWSLSGILWFQVDKEFDWRLINIPMPSSPSSLHIPFAANIWMQKLYKHRVMTRKKALQ